MYTKLLHIAIILLCTLMISCVDDSQESKSVSRDSLPMLITQIQKCTKLYTTEFKVHKIITHRDNKAISGSVLGMKIESGLPMSQRKIAIPMDATLKAFIDFSDFSEYNIHIKNGKMEITLPEPQITLTSSRIDHNNIRKHVDFLRGNYSDEELTKIEQNGRNAIIEEMSRMDIMEKAQMSAANTLLPIITKCGFDNKNVTITFSQITRSKDLRTLIDNTAIENVKKTIK